jgi:hypothetical protein
MPPINLGTVFTWVFSVSVIPLFFLVRYGQNHWGFDSIGTWYTMYCAIVFALLLGGAAIAVTALTRAILKLQRRLPL